MHLGGNNDRSMACTESGADKTAECFKERIALLIKVNYMLAKLALGLRLVRKSTKIKAQVVTSILSDGLGRNRS